MSVTRKKTSCMWNYFSRIEDDVLATCNICKQKLSYRASVSNLKKHLQRKHPETLILIEKDERPKRFTTKQEPIEILTDEDDNLQIFVQDNNFSLPYSSPNYSQRSEELVLNNGSIETFRRSNDKSKIDDAIMKLFVWDFQPFSIIDDRGFVNFLNTIVPSYKIPTKKYFSNSLLPVMYEEFKAEAKDKLSNEAQTVCLTIDVRTSSGNDSYMSLTGHYISPDFELKSLLLECVPLGLDRSSQTLARELTRVVNEWNITDKILMSVTDGEANLSNAILNMLGWRHIVCYANTLNLAMQDALYEVRDILDKVRTIVDYFRRNSNATKKLIEYQEQCGIQQPKRLLHEMPRKWNSTYLMLKRMVELHEVVCSIMELLDIELYPLAAEELEVCAELCDVLKPCEEVSKEISRQKYLTGSQVIPITRGLKFVINELLNKDYSEMVKNVIYKLQLGFIERFSSLEKDRSISVCTFLDPRFKLYFESESDAENAKIRVVELVTLIINQEREIDQLVEEDSVDNDVEMSIWEDFDKSMKDVEPKASSASIAASEVQRYLEDVVLDRNNSPMEWWKSHRCIYPTLAKLVKLKFGILATSVSCDHCEKIFTKASGIMAKRRTRFAARKLQQLMFLNINSTE